MHLFQFIDISSHLPLFKTVKMTHLLPLNLLDNIISQDSSNITKLLNSKIMHFQTHMHVNN